MIRILAGAVLVVMVGGAVWNFPWMAWATAEASFADPALVLSSAAHALLGLVLTSLMWLLSTGIVSQLSRAQALSRAALYLRGHLLVLPLSLAFGWVAVNLHAAFAVALLVIGCVLAAWRLRIRYAGQPDEAIARQYLLLSILAVLYGTWMGLIQHGPSASLSTYAHGDLPFYAGAIRAFAEFGFPLRDLTIEGHTPLPFNQLFPLLGAAAATLVPIDTFLFLGAAGGATFILCAAGTLTLYFRAVPSRAPSTARQFAFNGLAALAVFTATLYPSWNIGSIPMIYLAGVAISVMYLLRSPGQTSRTEAGALLAVALLLPMLSKITAGATLMPLAMLKGFRGLVGQFRSIHRAYWGLCGLVVCYAAWMLIEYGPVMLMAHAPIPLSVLYAKCCHAALPDVLLRDLATIILIVLTLLRFRTWQGGILAGSLLLGLFYPAAFFPSILCTGIVLSLLARENGYEFDWWHKVLLGAFVLAGYRAGFRDPAIVANFTITPLLLAALFVSLQPKFVPAGARMKVLVASWLPAVIVASLVGLTQAAAGKIPFDTGWWMDRKSYPALTPNEYELWDHVHKNLPKDALIFVDFVTKVPSLTEGWNTYSAQGGRQLYISQWKQSPTPSPDAPAIREKLSANAAVLAGRIHPTELRLSRQYGSFYAIFRTGQAHPSHWKLVHRNRGYAIFAIPDVVTHKTAPEALGG